MYNSYPSYQEIRKEVQETYDGFAVILEKFDWNMLSDSGSNTCEAYAILDDAVRAAGNMEDLIKEVASEVGKLKKDIKDLRAKGETQDADEKAAVRDIILRYIFDNCAEEIYEEYEVFCVPYPKKRA